MAQICNLHHLLCTSCGWRRRVADFADVAVVPRCAACGSIERPNVVLFGEMLPTGELARLESALAVGFDVVFSIGTSSLFPYISEPVRLAKTLGATTVEINPDETDISKVVDIRIRARAAAALESLATWRAVRQGPAVLPCWPWPKGCCSSPSPPAKPDFRNTEGSTMSTLYDSSISVLRRLCAAIAAGSAYVYRSLKLPDFLDSTEVTEADAWYDRFKFDPDADYSHFLDHARHRFSISETSNRILDTKAQWVLTTAAATLAVLFAAMAAIAPDAVSTLTGIMLVACFLVLAVSIGISAFVFLPCQRPMTMSVRNYIDNECNWTPSEAVANDAANLHVSTVELDQIIQWKADRIRNAGMWYFAGLIGSAATLAVTLMSPAPPTLSPSDSVACSPDLDPPVVSYLLESRCSRPLHQPPENR